MTYETGRAADARKWIAASALDHALLGGVVDAFPALRFYRANSDDDLEKRAQVRLPGWYQAQRQTLIGPCFDAAGAVWDARFRFTGCDFSMPLESHFQGGGDRDWFVLTHFGYGSDDDRRQLSGAGLLPIGVRFGYHLHLAVWLRPGKDARIFVLHLDQLRDARPEDKRQVAHPAFRSYESMLASIGEVRCGGDGEIVRRVTDTRGSRAGT